MTVKSIISATIGQPFTDLDYVSIPLALNVSTDDRDDDEVPAITPTWVTIDLTHKTVQEGSDKVMVRAMQCLDVLRPDWSPIGIDMVAAKLRTFLGNTDLTPYSAHWFADPDTETVH
jgi:hypothetical protein